jgi:hypothetical protein
MWLLSVMISLWLPTYHASTTPLDSVNIQFTYEKTEVGQNSKTTYYYQLNIQNNSNQAVYVIVPKWFGTTPGTQGIMRDVDDDSHDGMKEYAFYANESFEIYEVPAHGSISEANCKIRNKGDATVTSMKVPVYVAHNVKIGELKLDDYVPHKTFYGTNLTYEMQDVGTTQMSVALK